MNKKINISNETRQRLTSELTSATKVVKEYIIKKTYTIKGGENEDDLDLTPDECKTEEDVLKTTQEYANNALSDQYLVVLEENLRDCDNANSLYDIKKLKDRLEGYGFNTHDYLYLYVYDDDKNEVEDDPLDRKEFTADDENLICKRDYLEDTLGQIFDICDSACKDMFNTADFEDRDEIEKKALDKIYNIASDALHKYEFFSKIGRQLLCEKVSDKTSYGLVASTGELLNIRFGSAYDLASIKATSEFDAIIKMCTFMKIKHFHGFDYATDGCKIYEICEHDKNHLNSFSAKECYTICNSLGYELYAYSTFKDAVNDMKSVLQTFGDYNRSDRFTGYVINDPYGKKVGYVNENEKIISNMPC